MTTEPTTVLDHPSLGRVEVKYESFAHVAIPFGAITIELIISMGRKPKIPEALDLVVQRLPDLPMLEGEARRALLDDEEASPLVQEFKKCLFENIDSDTLIRHFGVDKPGNIDDARFVESLRLVRVWVYFHDEEPRISFYGFHYSIDQDLPTSLDVSLRTFDGEDRASFSIATWGEVTPKKTPVALEHRLLGHLEFDADGFASTELRLGETPIPIDITFERQPTKKRLDTAARLLTDLPALDERARTAVAEQLARADEDDAAPLYKSHHAEELGDAALLDDATFLARLQLVRLRVDVEKRGGTVDCDYSLGEEVTQYMLTVRFTLAGRLREISFES
jgi:hypothetical protein